MSQKFAASDKGSILPIFAVIVVGIVAVASLSIDQSRALLAHRKANVLADSSALAGVQALDRTIEGWSNAKRLILQVLAQSEFPEVNSVNFNEGMSYSLSLSAIDPFTTESDLLGDTVLIGGELAVTVERGFTGPTVPFRSLEGITNLYGLPPYYLANAIRTTVRRTDLSMPLSGANGVLLHGVRGIELAEVVATAYAKREEESTSPTAPIAIPACYLFRDVDPYSENLYAQELDNFDLSQHCGREVIARGLEMHDPSWAGGRERWLAEGMRRSEVIPRPPLHLYDDTRTGRMSFCYGEEKNGLFPNCKATPINAYLGFPGINPELVTDLEELIAAFEGTSRGGLQAGIGQPFRPAGRDFYLNNRFERFLGDFLQRVGPSTIGSFGLRPFREVFYERDPWSGDFIPTGHFPARRNRVEPLDGYTDPLAELMLEWPVPARAVITGAPGGDESLALLLDPANDDTQPLYASTGEFHFRYTNPMCHSERLPHNDDVNAAVREFDIMLIAPSDSRSSYCDLDASIFSPEGSVVEPTPESRPVVVGFVQAHIFDFRVTPFRRMTPGFPRHPMSGAASGVTALVDNNPESLLLRRGQSADALPWREPCFTPGLGRRPGRHCLPRLAPDAVDIRDSASWLPPVPMRSSHGCAGLRLRLGCNQRSFATSDTLYNPSPSLMDPYYTQESSEEESYP